VNEPSAVFVQVGPSDTLTTAVRTGDTWSAAGVDVTWSDGTIDVTAQTISRVAIRWCEALPAEALILGDAWERSYGDLQWRHRQPERLLPWYFLTHDAWTGRTTGAGVDAQPNAFCSWTVDADGFTLWLDLRNGAGPTQLNGRTLTAATVRRFEDGLIEDGGTPWLTLHAAVATMSSRLPARPEPAPVVGANNWYYAYGENFDEKAVLKDATTIVEFADGHPVKPFSVVDDGWYPGGIASGGPWDAGTPGVFDDMAGTAAAIKAIGARPGLWFRPLRVREPASSLDPSSPEVLDLVRTDLQRFKEWGFELVKHDFSTYDIFGRWGPSMVSGMTDGRPFHDTTRTSAEIVLAFYREIRRAADDVVLIGCNTVGHLAAGLVDVQRTGDDTSGRDWERTRKMGVNTLAFRLPQHNRFFTVDADCVPCTPQTPWELNQRFLDLVARSGTALFVSVDPAARTERSDRALSEGIRLALSGGDASGIEPADWLVNTTPTSWRSGAETIHYDWSRPWGADPVSP
jgi:alpha-galactosidase